MAAQAITKGLLEEAAQQITARVSVEGVAHGARRPYGGFFAQLTCSPGEILDTNGATAEYG